MINIPSAEEVEANGIELGEMNKLLLVKIEDLMLYVLEQEKKLREIDELKKRMAKMENYIKKDKNN
ncbi:hypothetical protein HZY62_21690 [Maribacter polysiphoniae]|uniref:Uncharacterized protein n=1 Tax=Maribacter polysiphoniae TaxID=429344 RepID=A0A316DH34_9FLAO|nr:hypothetical protein [Maribacter polysiphoniae]MBD1263214.1 hypothetical protein [Maribacter polysiphoniae]PWK17491.1 hypothetical protein LX92_04438 [Maribacter polysiphoniae]